MSDKITLQQLRAVLKGLPADTTFLISRDEEGNGFYKLMGFSWGNITEESRYDIEWDPADSKEEMSKKSAPCIVLWP